jgi:cysteinyl-tRNA synthetase
MLCIYNSLSRQIEDFIPLHDRKVGMYSCGPTVYDYQHIGHMRRYVGDDILIRVLQYNGFTVHHVMNVTDVGHLVSDSDTGEDKMEKGAKKFGRNVWDIANMFEKQFKDSCIALNIILPKNLMHATEYIQEQISLIKKLEEKGFTYMIRDGIYFDTSKFKNYFKLSRQNPDDLKKGVRVDFVEGKKHISDFALWKFSPQNQKRQMEWKSPWGTGFPGWHIECSAMAMRALGDSFDIHTGGIDHIAIHHTNEIAQSEGATGKKFVKYWVHHNFLEVEGEKMSKSKGNFYTVQDIEKKGYNPLVLRYLYLQTHYRQEMNFTWEALDASQKAYTKLVKEISTWEKPNIGCAGYEEKFLKAINDDINMPKALSLLWEIVKSDYPTSAKAETVMRMDTVFGLQLFTKKQREGKILIPAEIKNLIKEREEARKKGDFVTADRLRDKIQKVGFEVIDTTKGSEIRKKIHG